MHEFGFSTPNNSSGKDGRLAVSNGLIGKKKNIWWTLVVYGSLNECQASLRRARTFSA
jgi:hypothetical protein